MNITQICKKCGIDKPVSDYHPKRRQCKQCIAAWAKDHKRANPEATALILRTIHLRKRYGITPAQYDALFESQAGLCGVCGKAPEPGKRLVVDHCHESADIKIRGLIHASCNVGLGHLGDNIEGLEKALAYLKRAENK